MRRTYSKTTSLLLLIGTIIGTPASEADEIHTFTKAGKLDEVRTLLQQQPESVNKWDKKGKTPLHIAAALNHLDIARMLLKHRADVTAVDQSGWTALQRAAQAGHSQMVDLLIQNKADINHAAKNGTSQSRGP